MAIETYAKTLQDEKLRLVNEGRAKLEEYEGKDLPADVAQAIETLFNQAEAKGNEAKLYQSGAELGEWKNAIDESKRLPIGGLQTADGSRELEAMRDSFKSIPVKVGNHTIKYPYEFAKQEAKQIERGFIKLVNDVREMKGLEPKDFGQKAIAETTGGSGAAGGFLTPDIYVAEYIQKKYLASALRVAKARQVPLKSDITRVPATNAATGAATLTSEAQAAPTEATVTISEIVFQAYMYRTQMKASMESIADAEFDILRDILLPDIAQSFAAAENAAFTTGTGSSQPQGIIVGATTTLAAANAATITLDDVIGLLHTPPPQYRGVATYGFMCNDSTIAALRKLKDSQNRYLWEPNQQVGDPDSLYGKPLYYDNSMAAIGTGLKSLIVGDFNYFWIGDRAGLDVQVAKELFLANGQVGYFGFQRFDSHVMQAQAFAVLLHP